MFGLKADPTDNSYTLPSPCLLCPRHLAGMDKRRCVRTCEKINAYREGLPYKNLSFGELDEIEEEPQIKICVRPGCGKIAKVRNLCKSCYAAWQGGKILHPVLGEFVRVNKVKSERQAAKSARIQEKIKKVGKDMPKTIKGVKKTNKEIARPIKVYPGEKKE